MKIKLFIKLLIFVHVIFIFLIVHKHTLYVQENYIQQEMEKKKNELIKQKEQVTHQLHALTKNYAAIKQYAADHLNMRPYKLCQVKKIPDIHV